MKCFYGFISKNIFWNWIVECDEVFNYFKLILVSVLIFSYLDVNGGFFILDIDVSNDVIGVVLL